MNEEIKEILDNLRYSYISQSDVDKLSDCITTLQDKTEDLQNKIKNAKDLYENDDYSTLADDMYKELIKGSKDNELELIDYKLRVKKAIELLKNKKEEYSNLPDYHQYYLEGYDKAIELTHSSHSGIMLETIKSTTIKNCDDLLNILQNGSDNNV